MAAWATSRRPASPSTSATPGSSPIYEGTNGIQAMDLVGRKLDMAGGSCRGGLFAELRVRAGRPAGELQPGLGAALAAVERTTRHLQAGESDDRAAGASPYLRLFATRAGGFLLARGAQGRIRQSGCRMAGTRPFYVQALLPPAMALEQQILMGAEPLDPVLLAV